MEINDENDGQTLVLEPESPSSKKSVMVYEAWKKYMSLRTQGCDKQTILHNDVWKFTLKFWHFDINGQEGLVRSSNNLG